MCIYLEQERLLTISWTYISFIINVSVWLGFCMSVMNSGEA